MIPPVGDIHTHNQGAKDAVINLEQGQTELRPGALYSVGWHPWWAVPADWEWIGRMAREEQVALIGECGIDTLRGQGSIEEQLALTEKHARLAEELGKPLLLHIVGSWGEIIGLRKRMKPKQPWIIHGFRGKPELARQLVRAGFLISLGEKFNPGVPEAIGPEFLLRETD